MITGELHGAESVTRFLHSSRDWSNLAKRAKPSAFDPGSRYDEISAAHISGLEERVVWELSRRTLSGQPGRQAVLARADLKVEAVLRLDLKAIRDNDPFERHTAIRGWQNETRKSTALALSLAADLHVAPEPIRSV